MKFRPLFACVLLVVSVVAHAADKPGHAAVASAHPLATQAGMEVLGEGGNGCALAMAA